jgi:hypothetical protein
MSLLLGIGAKTPREEGMFCFEKRGKKTFGLWRAPGDWHARKRAKVFCFFFSKKKTFLPP